MNESSTKAILRSKGALLVVAAVTAGLGLIFIFLAGNNPPVTRQEAISYVGVFNRFEDSENYKELYFADGEVYEVYPHTQTEEFLNRMASLEKGTILYLTINPKIDYVVEIKTDTEELLNFEESQAAIDRYDNGYVALGIAVIGMAAFLVWYAFASQQSQQAAEAKKKKYRKSVRSQPLRQADRDVKCRVLLEKNVSGYQICYRRVKLVNELVINGMVYDEHKALLEFPHELYAKINGHHIMAGYEEAGNAGNTIIFFPVMF